MTEPRPAEIRSAGVVGLGLIGGSLVRDLSARGVRVRGYDRDAARRGAACGAALDRVTIVPSLAEAVDTADLVVIAVPVSAAPAVLAEALPHLGSVRVVIDVGSTKGSILAAAESLGVGERFVGCHPLAGDHRFGWEASRAGLFQGARVFLCRAPSTAAAALELTRALWASLGARPEELDGAEHDRRLAWTSHLPQLSAVGLALTLDRAGCERAELGPGGQGVTRLAGSSPEMWTAIAADNAAPLAAALAALQDRLGELRAAVERGDGEALGRLFAAGRAWFVRDERADAATRDGA